MVLRQDLSRLIQKYFPNFRKRVFDPVTTLFALLSQMLSPDKPCTETVARVNSERVAVGLEPSFPARVSPFHSDPGSGRHCQRGVGL